METNRNYTFSPTKPFVYFTLVNIFLSALVTENSRHTVLFTSMLISNDMAISLQTVG